MSRIRKPRASTGWKVKPHPVFAQLNRHHVRSLLDQAAQPGGHDRLALYTVLAAYAYEQQDGCCWESVEILATTCAMTPCAVIEALHGFLKAGWIELVSRGQTPGYRIKADALPVASS